MWRGFAGLRLLRPGEFAGDITYLARQFENCAGQRTPYVPPDEEFGDMLAQFNDDA
jgi:hypothetical protein